ncbi:MULTISPECIES: glutathione S-transferase family protein [Ralstonia solanacearum species complex]|uniref:Glutathione S-transferase family protein n=2 Tax=Ralstonia solanacearum TaxID=305 RepID=A0AAW5ZNR5_RALSL|nr:glutathione S-transferase family protein [Ralstonia solanacearum]AST30796.2 glutathione S-transferase family protein [Ralstonia solanacearum]ATJ87585.1 glutathione S-transferase [Ralstonia solanacearum]AYB52835.2 glutathione S-transferase family protein [Ralstonia solanacearum]AYB57410.1 glutathione S-transferase family protein [Ralstonia solanacearum]MBB6592389.1 glutathione S-transferase family protein [Ralstonia solanacearum]
MKLVIGNKNYSSWSLRPWLLARQAGIPFEEIRLRLGSEGFAAEIHRYSPAGRVPVLVDGDITVWDSLAICETLAERFPRARLWPEDPKARAHARSICAEMHAGFANLRSQMPMNVTAMLPGLGWNVAVQRDVDRIAQIWTELRQKYAAEGPFLFGHFTVADAFYAPVVSRFATYGVRLPESAKTYADHILNLPAMQEWIEGARGERDFLADDEPYRTALDEDTLVAANQ